MVYSESYFSTRETWRDWQIEARELIRLARVPRGARVLEIGCGGGGVLWMLCARGVRAVGVDTLESALHLARERVERKIDRETRREGDQEKNIPSSPVPLSLIRIGEDSRLPFPAHTFDALISQHAIEHLLDADAACREWKRVLKPNGRIALATPNARYPEPAHFADAAHARVFTPEDLGDLATRAGFVVEDCFTIFPFLSRVRVLRAVGVIAYRVFQRAPYFAVRGRTIVLAARK